jgi:hypothetical protein
MNAVVQSPPHVTSQESGNYLDWTELVSPTWALKSIQAHVGYGPQSLSDSPRIINKSNPQFAK